MKTFKSPLPELQLRYKTTELKKVKMGCSEDGYKLLKQLYEEDTLEYLETSVALFLNRCNNTIGWLKLSQGGMSGTVVDGKVVFATALKCGASGIILSHNHPLRSSCTAVLLEFERVGGTKVFGTSSFGRVGSVSIV